MKSLVRLNEQSFDHFEAVRLDETRAECYSATSSRFSRGDLGAQLDSPVLDKQRLEAGRARPEWPGGAPFAVCLTHDVDNVSLHSARIHYRALRSQAKHLLGNSIERRALGAVKGTAISMLSSVLKARRPDPLHCYERWLNLEAEFQAKSTFLFLPDCYDRPHYSDGGYRYSDYVTFDGRRCTVESMIREIHQRGWEVGLHPSWHTYRSASELRRDKQRLEEVIQAPVLSARQHFLHFDIRHTPQAYKDAGLLYDSSLGFNDDVGFRMGSCWPYEVFSQRNAEAGQLLELPLIVQDKCLTRTLGNGDLQQSIAHGMRVADKVQQVGGVLTLLWHPRLINDPLSMDVYRGLLLSLRERGAWFGTMAEIGRWWTEESAQWN